MNVKCLADFSFENKKVLELNRNWTPIGTTTLPKAIVKLVSTYSNGQPKARVVHPTEYYPITWADWSKIKPDDNEEFIRGSRSVFKIPEVIILSYFDKIKQPKSVFNRRTLFKRDQNTCQYCGVKPGYGELTLDHVTPKAKGGKTTWENIVLACVKCNSYKAARTPEEAGMQLRTIPAKPKYSLLKSETIKVDSWESYLGAAYWNVALTQD